MIAKAPYQDATGDDLDGSEFHDGTTTELASMAGRERASSGAAVLTIASQNPPLTGPYPNGYHFPPSHTWQEGFLRGCKALWKYTLTPLGFCVVLYGLNIVAWGGMLFLLLCNAAPAMCHPTCNDINSARRKWIEYTSQILNALFCVTGFGLAPWRFRDLYFLLKWRVRSRSEDLRRLAGIHRGWFRLRGSEQLPPKLGPESVSDYAAGKGLTSIPLPETKIPGPPLTGVRAPATSPWKLDFVIWFNVWNTFLQCCLAGFMWGMNRYDRPSWSTGLFVGLACGAAIIGGVMMLVEGKKVKRVEGVPVCDKDLKQLTRDKELGIVHYNNIKDKKPKEKKPQHQARDRKDT